jgi:hypothetical protein
MGLDENIQSWLTALLRHRAEVEAAIKLASDATLISHLKKGLNQLENTTIFYKKAERRLRDMETENSAPIAKAKSVIRPLITRAILTQYLCQNSLYLDSILDLIPSRKPEPAIAAIPLVGTEDVEEDFEVTMVQNEEEIKNTDFGQVCSTVTQKDRMIPVVEDVPTFS